MIGPYFGQLSEQFTDMVFLKVDVDANAVSMRSFDKGMNAVLCDRWLHATCMHGTSAAMDALLSESPSERKHSYFDTCRVSCTSKVHKAVVFTATVYLFVNCCLAWRLP